MLKKAKGKTMSKKRGGFLYRVLRNKDLVLEHVCSIKPVKHEDVRTSPEYPSVAIELRGRGVLYKRIPADKLHRIAAWIEGKKVPEPETI